MQKYQSVVQYNTGVAVAGASVTVKNYPSGTAATIYSDNGITLTANPLTTDSAGRFSFYAADGHYSLEVTGVSLTPYTVSDILLEDPADPTDITINYLTLMPNHRIYVSASNFGWQDLVSDIYSVGPNTPAQTNSFGNYYDYEMVNSTVTEVFANFHIVHDFALGTAIYPHIHLYVGSSATGNIRYGMEYSWAHRSDYPGAAPFSTPTTVYADFPIAASMAGKHCVVQVSPANAVLATSGIDTDALVKVRFFRDIGGGDTFPASVWALKADLHYQVSHFATKNRDPDFNA